MKSLPEPELPLLKIKLPEMVDLEVYLVKLADGTVVARTKDELKKSGMLPG